MREQSQASYGISEPRNGDHTEYLFVDAGILDHLNIHSFPTGKVLPTATMSAQNQDYEIAINATIKILKTPVVYKLEESAIMKQNDLIARAIERLESVL